MTAATTEPSSTVPVIVTVPVAASSTLVTCWEAEVNVELPPRVSVVVTATSKYLPTIVWSEGIL